MKLNQLQKPLSFVRQIYDLRPVIAKAVQKIYDEWVDDDSGGICDEIASEIGNILAYNIPDVEIREYGHDGDDHAAVIVSKDGEEYLVDVPAYVYERGGGYSWKKVNDVIFIPDNILISAI